MNISAVEVRRIASLARLSLTESEIEKMAEELTQILAFAESIRGVDTIGVTPTTHVIDLMNVWRADVPGGSLDREVVLSQAPQAEDGCFIAPRIV